MIDRPPALLVVEGLEDRFHALRSCLRDYDNGRLADEFEVIHLDCYDRLKNWYRTNAGRFVVMILIGVDFTAVADTGKLVGYPELKYPVPKGFDARSFQGLLIYALLRESNIDPVVPVLLLSHLPETERSHSYYSFMLYPAQGICHFLHVPELSGKARNGRVDGMSPGLAAVAERVDSGTLRPLDDKRRTHWRKFHQMVIGRSRRMVYLAHEIERLAPADSVVLLLGKPGVGKELVANALHRCSQRYRPNDRQRKFPSAVNIAALDRNLIEVELFGHARGAYTGSVGERPGVFEYGNGSTVFLDEIGEIGAEIQLKLLRTIENRRVKRIGSACETPVDMRIIAATNRTIDELAVSFRPDFYSRVVQQCLPVPSVSERWRNEAGAVVEADLREIFEFLLEEKNNGPSRPRRLDIDDGAVRLLYQLTNDYIKGSNAVFKGNIRALRSLLEQSWERAQHDGSRLVTVGHILSSISSQSLSARARTETPDQPQTIEGVVGRLNIKAVEKQAIVEALQSSDNNHIRAAELLGIHRDTLRRKIKEYNIDIG